MKNTYNIFVGKPEGKRPERRRGRRWEDNIESDLTEIGYHDTDRIHLAQDKDQWWAFVNTVMNFQVQVPQKVGDLTS
jgi:hypothetical protein